MRINVKAASLSCKLYEVNLSNIELNGILFGFFILSFSDYLENKAGYLDASVVVKSLHASARALPHYGRTDGR